MINHSGYGEKMEIKRDCIYCGCSKDKIKKRNCDQSLKFNVLSMDIQLHGGLMSW